MQACSTSRGRGEGRAGAIGVGCVGGVLLLEVEQAVGDRGRIDARRDFHSSGGYVTKQIPPFRVIGEGGVGNSCDEARDVEQVVDLREVSIGEGVTREATEDGAGGQGAGGEDGLSDLA